MGSTSNEPVASPATKKTLGERRVRADFNPSASKDVDVFKQAGVAFINQINSLSPDSTWSKEDTGEFMRLKALALTDIESGTSWAVKAATYKP